MLTIDAGIPVTERFLTVLYGEEVEAIKTREGREFSHKGELLGTASTPCHWQKPRAELDVGGKTPEEVLAALAAVWKEFLAEVGPDLDMYFGFTLDVWAWDRPAREFLPHQPGSFYMTLNVHRGCVTLYRIAVPERGERSCVHRTLSQVDGRWSDYVATGDVLNAADWLEFAAREAESSEARLGEIEREGLDLKRLLSWLGRTPQ